jgi:hypothetical protein
MYTIKNYTRKQAKRLGVVVKPSTNKTKKMDVFKKNKKVASIGAAGMSDYPTYMQSHGVKYAQTRRRLYKIRHEKDRKVVGTPGYYADKLLW